MGRRAGPSHRPSETHRPHHVTQQSVAAAKSAFPPRSHEVEPLRRLVPSGYQARRNRGWTALRRLESSIPRPLPAPRSAPCPAYENPRPGRPLVKRDRSVASGVRDGDDLPSIPRRPRSLPVRPAAKASRSRRGGLGIPPRGTESAAGREWACRLARDFGPATVAGVRDPPRHHAPSGRVGASRGGNSPTPGEKAAARRPTLVMIAASPAQQ